MVRRAEDFYRPPFGLSREIDEAWEMSDPAERVLWYAEVSMYRRALPRPRAVDLGRPKLQAWIDEDRWVVQCDQCLSAQIVSPDDARFYCVEATCPLFQVAPPTWRRIEFPQNVAAIEQRLTAITDPRRRFWWDPRQEHPAWLDLALNSFNPELDWPGGQPPRG